MQNTHKVYFESYGDDDCLDIALDGSDKGDPLYPTTINNLVKVNLYDDAGVIHFAYLNPDLVKSIVPLAIVADFEQ